VNLSIYRQLLMGTAGFEPATSRVWEIAQIDAIVNELDALREQHGLSKADLAR
jgi:hypothetical protein